MSSAWDLSEVTPSSFLSVISQVDRSNSVAVQWYNWEAKHHTSRGKADVIRQNVSKWAVVSLAGWGWCFYFFRNFSDCGLKMKFLMPFSLPVCLLDQALLWDWSHWNQWVSVAAVLSKTSSLQLKRRSKILTSNLSPRDRNKWDHVADGGVCDWHWL